MLIYSQCKYFNCLMLYLYMWKQYEFANEMHSMGNKTCEHINVHTYLIAQQMGPANKHVH